MEGNMLWFKSCPKCSTGDLSEGKDRYGMYIFCLQCGHYLSQAEEVVLSYTARFGTGLRAGVPRASAAGAGGRAHAGVA
jgi:hypothetical protein